MLYPTLPDDAVARIAFTTVDLWPGEGWNFVFGQASLSQRVGVWSIHRNGDPEAGEDPFRLCLLRTVKMATHETGHMFSMVHCTFFRCNMAGCNHQEESDRNPFWLCPQCMAKLCFATDVKPQEWFAHMAEFCDRQGFAEEKQFFERSRKAIGK
jgi:archaemetzincin